MRQSDRTRIQRIREEIGIGEGHNIEDLSYTPFGASSEGGIYAIALTNFSPAWMVYSCLKPDPVPEVDRVQAMAVLSLEADRISASIGDVTART